MDEFDNCPTVENTHLEDLNADTLIDLVVQFEDQDEAFAQASGMAKVTGQLMDGTLRHL